MPFPKGWSGVVVRLGLRAAGFWLAVLTSSWGSEYVALVAFSTLLYAAAAALIGGTDP